MADKKISALTGASTPLAGTEVLPIVQSNATVKVAVSDLTAGRATSALSYTSTATTGTAPFTVASTTNVANLNASTLNGATFAAPGAIGGTTAAAGNFTLLTATAPAATDAVLNLIASTNNYAAGINLKANNSNGAIYNYISSTYGATDMWYVGGNGLSQTLVFKTGSTERQKIDASGIVTMSAYGAGAATFSAAGVISSVSDETWKIKDGVPSDPDAMLKKLEPGYWYYNEEKKEIFGKERQLGFYAQNVNAAVGPEAAPEPEENKPWGYYDRSVLAVVVMSLQNALSKVESLELRIQALEAKG
jgi:hypothetical protein